ncbi:Coagulation factor XI [Exaiptasia diaphana]|nr:Coagulation factor XI [Exaiptasia diaphana]
MENDIAVLKLKTNITFNDKVRPICLPTKRFPDGENCYATGWGWINAFRKDSHDQPVRSPILKQLKVPLVSDLECEKLFRRLPPGVICGGYKVEPKGICKGDSGGPLACKNESGIWNLAGTVSFSLDGCAQKDTYDYYTDMANYKGWVEDQINKN